MFKNSKWSNLGLWASIASLAYLFLGDMGITIAPDKYNMYIDSISTILIMAGILSNPKEGRFYRDTPCCHHHDEEQYEEN